MSSSGSTLKPGSVITSPSTVTTFFLIFSLISFRLPNPILERTLSTLSFAIFSTPFPLEWREDPEKHSGSSTPFMKLTGIFSPTFTENIRLIENSPYTRLPNNVCIE